MLNPSETKFILECSFTLFIPFFFRVVTPRKWFKSAGGYLKTKVTIFDICSMQLFKNDKPRK
jgi:hypothetical protein